MLIADAGGLLAFVLPLLAGIGLPETEKLALGDVALVRLAGVATPAICCRHGVVAVRGENFGCWFPRPPRHLVIKAWKLPACA
jgi:hypothetical protein